MSAQFNLQAGVGLTDATRKSRWPARMDLYQSLTGLCLGLFMLGHTVFVSSILWGKDTMWTITKFFEGYFFFGKAYPGLVSIIVGLMFVMFIAHAFLAMRKLPANFKQWQVFAAHRKLLRHGNTTLWWIQALTGFALFFVVSAHLYQMLMHPGAIGPFESADRVWSERWWPLYLFMLFAVQLHAFIGLYRLAMKWNWLVGDNPSASRARAIKKTLTVIFLVLGAVSIFDGVTSLSTYIKIGIDHSDKVGEVYTPAWVQQQPGAVK
jgi:fumarate reductase subunit C